LNVTNYSINPDTITPEGIKVDSGGFNINLQEIDNVINRMETCLDELILKEYSLSVDAQCLTRFIRPLPIHRNCINIKFVEPVKSKCSEWHFLKEKAPQKLCDAKGLEENPECPCRWRWAIQDDCNLVIPVGHSDFLYLYDIIRIHTGCNNYWADPNLSICAQEVLKEK
jgi:hypothetical protein